MSSFADSNGRPAPAVQPPREHVRPGDDIPSDVIPEGRPKLKLKARSKPKAANRSQSGGSSSIFGEAKPREAVLKAKGVDVQTLWLPGDHYSIIDVASDDWLSQIEAIKDWL